MNNPLQEGESAVEANSGTEVTIQKIKGEIATCLYKDNKGILHEKDIPIK